MAHDINSFTFTGRLVDDPEFYPGKDGKKDVVRFRIATNYDDKNANFFPITVFGKLASTHAENLCKGSAVIVMGNVANNDFEKNGTKQFSYNFVADTVKYTGGTRPGQGDE